MWKRRGIKQRKCCFRNYPTKFWAQAQEKVGRFASPSKHKTELHFAWEQAWQKEKSRAFYSRITSFYIFSRVQISFWKKKLVELKIIINSCIKNLGTKKLQFCKSNYAFYSLEKKRWKKKQPKPVYYVYSITWEQKSCNEGCMLKQPLVTEKRHIGAKVLLKSHLENVRKSTISYFVEFLSYPRINMHPVKPQANSFPF